MNKKRALFQPFAILAFLFIILFFTSHAVHAATFNVTDATTLRSALATAESNNQDNTINLAAGTYNGGSLGYLMDNTSGYALTLSGHGQSDTFITGLGDVMTLGTNGPLTIQNLTFKDCEASALVIPGSSGTDTNSLIINVQNVSFIHNGGTGLYINPYNGSQGGSVTVTDSTFDDNTYGGFYLKNTNSGAPALPLTFSRHTVINNGPHGIYAEQSADGSDMVFDRNYSANNFPAWGAGLAVLAD